MSPAGSDRVYDTIVVAASIIGCAISLELGRAGRRVLCADAGLTAGSGSTGASSAIVRFHYSDAVATGVAWDSLFDWTAWRDYVDLPRGEPLAQYVTTGALVLDAPGSPRRATLGNFDLLGISYTELSAADICREFPEMCTESFWPPKTPDDSGFWDLGRGEVGGYLTPAAGYVDDPQLAARNLMQAAAGAGVRFCFRRLVRSVIVVGDRAAGVEFDGGGLCLRRSWSTRAARRATASTSWRGLPATWPCAGDRYAPKPTRYQRRRAFAPAAAAFSSPTLTSELPSARTARTDCTSAAWSPNATPWSGWRIRGRTAISRRRIA